MDRTVRRQINTLFNIGVIRDLTDGQLLERFATGQGEPAELAFAALVERHGPMVLRVCRARLADPEEALDAFQATFLVLIEKSRGLWVRDSLGPWLHQVAFRTASCALSAAARRRQVERRAAELAVTAQEPDHAAGQELERALHEEINKLPHRYREAIVLCDLEGHTCEEAARRIGRPVGTVKCWRARGRERLRQRLIRSGLAPSLAPGTVLEVSLAQRGMHEPQVAKAIDVLTDSLTAGAFPASVHALVKGVFKAMILSKLKTAAAVICAAAFLVTGLGTVARVAAGDPQKSGESAENELRKATELRPLPSPAEPRPLPVPIGLKVRGDEVWSLSLRDAISIGLDNSGDVRVQPRHAPLTEPGAAVLMPEAMDKLKDGNLVIQPTKADVNPQRFRARVMALVRSIEQQYWNLVQMHVQLWSSEKAVELARKIVNREQADLVVGKGTVADVAEAQSRLEQFNLDLGTRTADVITTERQLRNILGLPPVDNRRIIPVTPPAEAKIEPDWDRSLAVMLVKQPDVVEAKAIQAAFKAATMANNPISEPGPPAIRSETPPAGIEGQAVQSPTSAFLKQATHQATHTLARFMLEIDANYKQLQTATRLRAAAAQRLDAQRAYYEEGRITIDRFLDAVSQYAAAVAQEAQFKTTYNVSIAAFEEAKGTLLEYNNISVVEQPGAKKLRQLNSDGETKSTSLEAPAPARNQLASLPQGPRAKTDEAKPTPASPDAASPGRTISFQMTINVGSGPVEIKGSFTVSPAGASEATKSP